MSEKLDAAVKIFEHLAKIQKHVFAGSFVIFLGTLIAVNGYFPWLFGGVLQQLGLPAETYKMTLLISAVVFAVCLVQRASSVVVTAVQRYRSSFADRRKKAKIKKHEDNLLSRVTEDFPLGYTFLLQGVAASYGGGLLEFDPQHFGEEVHIELRRMEYAGYIKIHPPSYLHRTTMKESMRMLSIPCSSKKKKRSSRTTHKG